MRLLRLLPLASAESLKEKTNCFGIKRHKNPIEIKPKTQIRKIEKKR
jgi:hypothetical protein